MEVGADIVVFAAVFGENSVVIGANTVVFFVVVVVVLVVGLGLFWVQFWS